MAVSRNEVLHQPQPGSVCIPTKFIKDSHTSTEKMVDTSHRENKGTISLLSRDSLYLVNRLKGFVPCPSASVPQQSRSRSSYSREASKVKSERFPKTNAVPSMRKIDEMERKQRNQHNRLSIPHNPLTTFLG